MGVCLNCIPLCPSANPYNLEPNIGLGGFQTYKFCFILYITGGQQERSLVYDEGDSYYLPK